MFKMKKLISGLEGFRLPQPKPEDVHATNMEYLAGMDSELKMRYYLYLEMARILDENAVILSPIQWNIQQASSDLNPENPENPLDTLLAGHLAQLNSSFTEFEKNHPELY